MSTSDPQAPAGSPDSRRTPPLSRLVGRRPNQGAAVAAKTVITDVRTLVRAEIQLAKAEIAEGVKAKVMGAGFFIVVAVIGWLAIQVFLVFLGFLFALFLPGWAAVGLVLLLLLIAMGVLGFLGYRKLQVPASLATTKETVAESKLATRTAVDQLKANSRQGIQDAKAEVGDAATVLKQRVDERLGRTEPWPLAPAPTTPPERTPAPLPAAQTPAPLPTTGAAAASGLPPAGSVPVAPLVDSRPPGERYPTPGDAPGSATMPAPPADPTSDDR